MSTSTVLPLALSAVIALLPATTTANPYVESKPNRSWISMSGTVASTSTGRFTLDYGNGQVIVEMDDWDWFDEASLLTPGEKVTVYGRIDDNLYEHRTIEASSVYVFDRSTYYYASPDDEESYYSFYVYPHLAVLPDGSWISISGTVESVDGREFVLDTGLRTVRVDTRTMGYNPLDDLGLPQIDPGDRVSVSGILDANFFEKHEILAKSILSLHRDDGRRDAETP